MSEDPLGLDGLPKVEDSKDVPSVSERVDGATPSFQAILYCLGEDRVAKVYGTENVWGRIDLNDPQIRTSIIERELRCLQSLSI